MHCSIEVGLLAAPTKLSLGVRLLIADLLPICTEFEHLLVRLFGQMMMMMMSCGCFTDNNYRPQLGSMMTQAENAFGRRICFLKIIGYNTEIFIRVGKSCYGKSTPPGKSTQPHLSNIYVSYILRLLLLRLIRQKISF
jgi:hypothetical protein